MRRVHWGVFLVFALFFASFLWFVGGFTDFVERKTAPPLGLSKDYLTLNAYMADLGFTTYEQKAEFMARLLALVENREVTIVHLSGYLAIGLYDGRELYGSSPLIFGRSLGPADSRQDKLLANGNYLKAGDDMVYHWDKADFEIVGIYDSAHPLAESRETEFICSLFNPKYIKGCYISGTYHIDTSDSELRASIIALFEEPGRGQVAYYTPANKSSWAFLKDYLFGYHNYMGNTKYLGLALLTCFACFTLLYNIIWGQKKFAAISLHFGATRAGLFLVLGKRILLNLLPGTAAGLGLYLLLQKLGRIWGGSTLAEQTVFTVFGLTLVLLGLIFTLAFSLVKFEIKEGEKA